MSAMLHNSRLSGHKSSVVYKPADMPINRTAFVPPFRATFPTRLVSTVEEG